MTRASRYLDRYMGRRIWHHSSQETVSRETSWYSRRHRPPDMGKSSCRARPNSCRKQPWTTPRRPVASKRRTPQTSTAAAVAWSSRPPRAGAGGGPTQMSGLLDSRSYAALNHTTAGTVRSPDNPGWTGPRPECCARAEPRTKVGSTPGRDAAPAKGVSTSPEPGTCAAAWEQGDRSRRQFLHWPVHRDPLNKPREGTHALRELQHGSLSEGPATDDVPCAVYPHAVRHGESTKIHPSIFTWRPNC